eukprot:s1995_g10.t1
MNAAGKLSVMMTGLMLAATSSMCEVTPAAQADPIVLFEIGGIDATYEAVELNKAVIEPMSWEDFKDPEQKEDAYHFVKATTPKELRINLEGIGIGDKDSVMIIINEQLRGGGLGTKKGVRFCTGEEARPHYVCVVETDNQTREPHLQQPRCMDAAGITFEDGVNPVIQASLTLFHFDFYIRTSATRGKKISFVTDVWLDAKRRS